MEHLPPVGWADVATKHDIAVLRENLDARDARLGLRMDALEGRLEARMDALEGRMDALEERLGSRMEGLERQMGEFEQRTDLKLEALEHRMLARFHADLVSQTRLFVFSTIGSLATIASLAFAAARMPS